MRISTRPRDPGRVDDHSNYIVVFDGREQWYHTTGRGIVTADEEKGMIVFFEASENGCPVMDDRGNIPTHTIYGPVRINRLHNWPGFR